MLKIVAATDPLPVENLIITIYAAPGLWKTSIAQTADSPLTLDADRGIHRAFNRKASVTVTRWADVVEMTAEDLAPYKTIVVDTAGRVLDVMAQNIIDGNPKMGNAAGGLTLPGYGALKSRFSNWLSFLRTQGKDVILVAHMDEQAKGDDVQERIDAQGGSRNEIYKSSDAMCRIRLDGKDQRYLDFDPRQGGFGKNPAQLPKITVPSLKDNPAFLAEVIVKIKAALNQQTTKQAESVKSEEEWAGAVAEASNVEEVNKLLKLAKERSLGKRDKGLLATKAMTLGLEFSKTDGWFIQKAVA